MTVISSACSGLSAEAESEREIGGYCARSARRRSALGPANPIHRLCRTAQTKRRISPIARATCGCRV
jgi:hypothetical protein